jgi:flagellin
MEDKMALIINHNMPAMKAARFLGNSYDKLSKSIDRLSSGLRINSAADDAAGLAIREMMRADIATTAQGIRNASDAISLIQTADGALAVIDEKLSRMKELAEQAATGTYTTVQRQIINSEYQAMAAEIDRIAAATNFNGIRLLDGSTNALNNGQGIRIHFGVGNSAAEDYYYIHLDNTMATNPNGLRIGGDGQNDIWSAGPYGDQPGGCCGGTISSLSSAAVDNSTGGFMYGYNYDDNSLTDEQLFNSRYLAGKYGAARSATSATYQAIINNVNQGTQSRVIVDISANMDAAPTNSSLVAICLDNDEVFYFGSAEVVALLPGLTNKRVNVGVDATGTAQMLASAINNTNSSNYWAFSSGTGRVVIFRKDGGDNNNLIIEEYSNSAAEAAKITYTNVTTGISSQSANMFSLGGEHWGVLQANSLAGGGYGLALIGRDIGASRDLAIAGGTDGYDTDWSAKLSAAGITAGERFIGNLKRSSFTEVQNANNGDWDGAEIRTQEAAQRSLVALNAAIERKDIIRANLGATQNRLEGTITNLTIQVENLQAAESRISDVDVASEMTEFTKNNILAQAATSMLAQANSLGGLALTLIRGA